MHSAVLNKASKSSQKQMSSSNKQIAKYESKEETKQIESETEKKPNQSLDSEMLNNIPSDCDSKTVGNTVSPTVDSRAPERRVLSISSEQLFLSASGSLNTQRVNKQAFYNIQQDATEAEATKIKTVLKEIFKQQFDEEQQQKIDK